jgi:hypothetical protein
MPTSVSVNELASPQDRARGLAEDLTKAAIRLLVAGGLVSLAVGMIYLNLLVGPAEVADLGQIVGP